MKSMKSMKRWMGSLTVLLVVGSPGCFTDVGQSKTVLAVVLDVSSQVTSSELATVVGGLNQLVQSQAGSASGSLQVILFKVAVTAQEVMGLTPVSPDQVAAIQSALNKVSILGGDANLADGLNLAEAALSKSTSGDRMILIVTKGRGVNPIHFTDAAQAIRGRGTAIGALPMGIGANQSSLQEVSAFNVPASAASASALADQVQSLLTAAGQRPSPNDLYFPQVADGGGWKTRFLLLNNTQTPVQGTLSFSRDDGSPMTVTLGATTGSQFSISVEARATAVLETAGTGPELQVGWAKGDVNSSLQGVAVFTLQGGDGKLVSSVGVQSSPLRARHSVAVEKVAASRRDVGIAVANPNGQDLTLTTQLLDSAGRSLGSQTIALKPLGHKAIFASNLFPSVTADVNGTLVVTGSLSFALTGLELDRDLLTSLPVF
ncbi:MAG: VWA domain-containing protein [Acidobacteria bacterium]|nr:VWA domain-containing protein [Acidobacteriota bacterium]